MTIRFWGRDDDESRTAAIRRLAADNPLPPPKVLYAGCGDSRTGGHSRWERQAMRTRSLIPFGRKRA